LQPRRNARRLRIMTTRQPEEHSGTRLPEPRLPERLPLEVRLVVHTHWDREWYRPFAQFRSRLVALIDEGLDGASRGSVSQGSEAGSPFLLDGQAVILEDYLDVRPERSADVSSALRQGAIEAGPWYVLADSLIPSGEGLVRNLLAGRRLLRSLRATAPDVLYCPDSFGHPAALPAIAAGFGFGVVILWRGYGGASHPPGDTARWYAPDESSVILYHLPPDGYEFGSHLPPEIDAARGRWSSIRDVLAPRSVTGLALLTVGADHHAPQARLDDAVAALSAAAQPVVIARSSLAGFGRELAARAEKASLPPVHGELRDSYGYTWTLQGTLGARAELKRRYARVEREMVRDVEPWTALARIGRNAVDRRALTHAAWKPLLLCQPHDTLCGCSVDDVASAMAERLTEASSAGEELRATAIMALVGHDGNDARRAPAKWSAVALVRNPAPRVRGGVTEIDVDLVYDDAPVGPASAGIEPRVRPTGPLSLGSPPTVVQELGRERTFVREEASRHYPWNRLVERRRVLAWVDAVPGYGLVTLPVEEKRRRAPALPMGVSGRAGAINGSALRVDAHGDSLRLTGTNTGIELADWIMFEVEGERGDLYTRSAIPHSRARASLRRSKVTARGPLRAELTCDWTLRVPERRLTSAAGEPRRAAATRLEIQTAIQLDAGAPFVRLVVRGTNDATDARLRVGFRTGIQSPFVVADAAFGPVARAAVDHAVSPGEVAQPTAPLHRYVTAFADDRGVTVYSDGLAEHEVDDAGVIWVTLFRAVGELSRHDLPERPGHAGYPVATPAAQSIGPFEAHFAMALHGPRYDAETSLIERIADDVLQPLRGSTWRTAINPPAAIRGVELAGDGLAFSSMKESDDGDWLVLRCVNQLDHQVHGRWKISLLREARLARLDETALESLTVQEDGVDFLAPPRGIVTLLVR
jgi:mannosylglycerate hydrolase